METKQSNSWLTIWILLLSFASGFSNVVALRSFLWPVSHVTGLASQMAMSLAQGQTDLVFMLFRGFVLFFLGATVSGILFHERKFQPGKRYGILLSIGALIIFALRNSSHLHLFLFFFMGLNNTMFILYRGILVRTTHITGYLTDAGFELGAIIRQGTFRLWRLAFYLISIGLFMAGGVLAALPKISPVVPLSLIYAALGVYYFILRRIALAAAKAKQTN